MTRTYSLLIEGDESGYSAYVPELPTILVTGRSEEELTQRASEAIRLYWEYMLTCRRRPFVKRSKSNYPPKPDTSS